MPQVLHASASTVRCAAHPCTRAGSATTVQGCTIKRGRSGAVPIVGAGRPRQVTFEIESLGRDGTGHSTCAIAAATARPAHSARQCMRHGAICPPHEQVVVTSEPTAERPRRRAPRVGVRHRGLHDGGRDTASYRPALTSPYARTGLLRQPQLPREHGEVLEHWAFRPLGRHRRGSRPRPEQQQHQRARSVRQRGAGVARAREAAQVARRSASACSEHVAPRARAYVRLFLLIHPTSFPRARQAPRMASASSAAGAALRQR
jgi:hypothetical protein